MRGLHVKFFVAVGLAFAAGFLAAHGPTAMAKAGASKDLAGKTFRVSIDEVKQNLVFAEGFTGSYSKTVTLSDGTKRQIELTPMTRADGMQVVEFKDSGFRSYMSLSGTTTNGSLMVQIVDHERSSVALREEGWKLPDLKR